MQNVVSIGGDDGRVGVEEGARLNTNLCTMCWWSLLARVDMVHAYLGLPPVPNQRRVGRTSGQGSCNTTPPLSPLKPILLLHGCGRLSQTLVQPAAPWRGSSCHPAGSDCWDFFIEEDGGIQVGGVA
jgi:hypothetical protein